MATEYSFYAEMFHGKLIPEPEWPRCALQAEQLVKELTGGKADQSGEPARMAVCAAAEEVYYRDNNRENGATMADPYAAARRWLAGTGLLYTGV